MDAQFGIISGKYTLDEVHEALLPYEDFLHKRDIELGLGFRV